MNQIKSLCIIVFCLCLTLIGSAQMPSGWPFLNNQVGEITGTPGEIRPLGGNTSSNTGIHVRFHGGVDITNGGSIEVYAIDGGIITWNNPANGTNCWTSEIYIGDYIYKHVEIDNSWTWGDVIVAGELIGEMYSFSPNGNCDLHVHMEMQNETINYFDLLSPFVDNEDPQIWDFNNGYWLTSPNSPSPEPDFAEVVRFYTNGIDNDNFPNNSNTGNLKLFGGANTPGDASFHINFDVNEPMYDHTIVYGRVDMILRTRDDQVNNTGGNNGGNCAPNSISYKIEDYNFWNGNSYDVSNAVDFGTLVTGNSLNVNNPANNLFAQPTTCCTLLDFIITSDIHSGTSVDRYWNTKLRDGATETWIQDNSLNGHANINTRFPDGEHFVFVESADYVGNLIDSRVPVVVDNFMPYIKEVTLLYGGSPYLTHRWNYNSTTTNIEYEEIEHDGPFLDFNLMQIQVKASESLTSFDLVLTQDGNTLQAGNAEVSQGATVVTYTYVLEEGESISNYCLQISGEDLAGNQLLSLQNLPGYSPGGDISSSSIYIPERNNTGAWVPALGSSHTGTDEVHCFEVNGCFGGGNFMPEGAGEGNLFSVAGGCMYVDFETPNPPASNDGTVNFTNLSSSPNLPLTFNWDFGDGATSELEHPSHFYNTEGATGNLVCYNVTLDVVDSSTSPQTGSIIKEICVPVISNDGSFVTGVISQPNSCPSVIAVDQVITYEANAYGGIPPYTYEWSFGAASGAEPSEVATGAGPHSISYSNSSSIANEVYVTVTDSQGNYDIVGPCYVDVTSNPGSITFNWLESETCVDAPIHFEADLPPPFEFAGTVTYEWDFGDGTVSYPSGIYWEHTYTTDGTYTVTFTVHDANGSYPVQQTIVITNCNPPSPSYDFTINGQSDPITIQDGQPGYAGFQLLVNGEEPSNGETYCTRFEITNQAFSYFCTPDHQSLEFFEFDFNTSAGGNDCTNITNTPWYGCNSITMYVWESSLCLPANGLPTVAEITKPCHVFLEYDPLQVTAINLLETGTCQTYLQVEAEDGLRKSTTIDQGICNGQIQDYKAYDWKAYDIAGNEIDILFPSNNKCAEINREHEYFDQFESGFASFVVKSWVSDYGNNVEEKTEYISMDIPLRINIPLVTTQCPEVEAPLFDGEIVTGGSGNYIYTYTGNLSLLDITNEAIPILNTIGIQAPSSVNFNFKVEDDDTGCILYIENFFIYVDHISVNITSDQTNLCAGQGLNNTLNADVTGGSGNYQYQWEPVGLLDDPFAENPILSPPNSGTISCFLVVTDDTGCSSNDAATLTVSESFPVANITGFSPTHLCYGKSLQLGGKASDPGSGVNPRDYLWTSTNPLFIESTEPKPYFTPDQYDEGNLYSFTLTVSDPTNGCFDQAIQYVNVWPQWEYTGYESELKTLIKGQGAPLWSSNDNEITGGATPPFTATWLPNNTFTYGVVNNSIGIPASEGNFVPIVSDESLTLEVTDRRKCVNEFKTNRYIILEEEAVLHVVSNPSGAVCEGEEICLTVSFYSNYIGNSPWLLPPSISCEAGAASGTLDLIDGQVGVYQGEICFNSPAVSSPPWDKKTISVEIDDELFGILESEFTYIVLEPGISADQFVCIPNSSNNFYRTGNKIHIGGPPDHIDWPPDCDNPNIPFNSQSNFMGGDEIRFYSNLNFYSGNNVISHSVIAPCIEPPLFAMAPDDIVDVDTSIVDDMVTERNTVLIDKDAKLHIQPNPFSSSIEIFYEIDSPEIEMVNIEIYHITGHLVDHVFSGIVNDNSRQRILYDGSRLDPGVYLCRMQIGETGNISQRIIKIVP